MTFTKTPIALSLLLHSSIVFAAKGTNEQSVAESEVEVITVQSDYRQQSLQKSAASISVLSEQDLALRNSQNLEEIAAGVANVNFSSGSQRARYYQIRGIGERSQFQEPINQSVGMLIDDIDFSGIGSVSSTFDIGQVEFYRGPQGTRFGANALAGLIYMSSNQPSETFEGAVRLSAGNYGSQGIAATVSGPASDAVNYRFSAEQYKSDGFIENTYLGKDDTNNRDELTLRGKLAIQASKDLTFDVTLIHADFDNGYDAFSLDNTRQTLSDQPGFDQQETTAMSTKATYSKFSAFDVVAIVSHADSDLAYGYDEDWSYVGLHPWEYSSTDHYLRDRKTSTAELRLVSTPEQKIFSGTTDWVAGVYYKQDKEQLTRQYTYLESDFTSTFEAKNLAFYGQLDSALTKRLTLTTGVRFEQRDSDYDNSQALAFAPDDTMVGAKVVLSYQLNDDAMTYASINRGFKAGSVNTSGSLSDDLRAFDPEYLVNYEIGYKANLLNNNAFVRAAVFYMNRDDIQISSYHLSEREDGSAEFINYWDNAAQGSNYGVEVEGTINVSEQVELYGNVGLLETEFKGYVYADGTTEQGRDQAHAPSYQFSVGVNYFPNEHWQINVSVDGKDEFYFSDSHTEKSDDISVLNASVRYLQDQWQLKLWARNITDEEYATRGFYFGNDPRDGYSAKPYYQFAEPAVFGLTLDYQF